MQTGIQVVYERTSLWEILLYGFISFLITYLLHRRGRFKVFRKREVRILAVLGVILPFVDVVETWFGYEHEGNPFVIHTIGLLAEGGWLIFILSHVVVSILVVILGWKSMSEKEVIARAALFGSVVYLILLIVMNALLLKIYGVY